MANEKQLANLKHTVKGAPSLNPNGRPKGSRNRKTVLGKLLNLKTTEKNPLTGKRQKMTYLELMFLVQIKKAVKQGDTLAFRALIERFEGTAVKYSEMLSMEMMQASGGQFQDEPATPAGTTIIRRIVFRTRETTSAAQVVNE